MFSLNAWWLDRHLALFRFMNRERCGWNKRREYFFPSHAMARRGVGHMRLTRYVTSNARMRKRERERRACGWYIYPVNIIRINAMYIWLAWRYWLGMIDQQRVAFPKRLPSRMLVIDINCWISVCEFSREFDNGHNRPWAFFQRFFGV